MGFLGIGDDDPPPLINARGDKLSEGEVRALLQKKISPQDLESSNKSFLYSLIHLGPQQVAEMLSNWMTAGAPPKPLDVGKIFGEQQALVGVEARAAAGRGIAGLFGFGKKIGEAAPMAPNVPYSATPAPKVSLNPLFNPAYGGLKFGGGR